MKRTDNHKIFRRWQNPFSGRYSLAYITLDLFGSWNIVKTCGKSGGIAGDLVTLPCRSQAEALHVFKGMHRRYIQHGYQPVFTSRNIV